MIFTIALESLVGSKKVGKKLSLYMFVCTYVFPCLIWTNVFFQLVVINDPSYLRNKCPQFLFGCVSSYRYRITRYFDFPSAMFLSKSATFNL